MKDLVKINKLISPRCKSMCQAIEKEKCCDKIFCGITEKYLERVGKSYDKPNYLNVPYLSKTGCVVPIEFRPICTCFACPDVLRDKKIKKRWEQLQTKIRTILKI